MGRAGQNPSFAVVVGVRGGAKGDGAVFVVCDGDAFWPFLLLYVERLFFINAKFYAKGLGVVDYAKGVIDERFDVYLRGRSGEVWCGENFVDALNG